MLQSHTKLQSHLPIRKYSSHGSMGQGEVFLVIHSSNQLLHGIPRVTRVIHFCSVCHALQQTSLAHGQWQKSKITNKPNDLSVSITSACLMFANTSLLKGSHVIKCGILQKALQFLMAKGVNLGSPKKSGSFCNHIELSWI